MGMLDSLSLSSLPVISSAAALANVGGSLWATQESEKEAQATREWQEGMASTSHQREVADLKAAGLNPMLSAMHGGAAVPGGAVGQVAGGNPGEGVGRGIGSALELSEIKVAEAQADKLSAEASEARARTPTYGVSMEKMRQDINESIAKVQDLMASVGQRQASAGQMLQATENLRAQLPQIKATVDNLESLTRLNDAQLGKVAADIGRSLAETREIVQRVKQNLPEAQRILAQLDMAIKQPKAAAAVTEAPIHESMFGKLAALMRVFNPLAGLISTGDR